jgi:hypothetical protein
VRCVSLRRPAGGRVSVTAFPGRIFTSRAHSAEVPVFVPGRPYPAIAEFARLTSFTVTRPHRLRARSRGYVPKASTHASD